MLGLCLRIFIVQSAENKNTPIFSYMCMTIPVEAKELFKTKFEAFGNERFYKFLLNYAINKVVEKEAEGTKKTKSKIKTQEERSYISPEIELMDYYDRFIDLFRQEGETVYMDIAKLFRKAGHKVYRIMLKKSLIKKSDRFLNGVE